MTELQKNRCVECKCKCTCDASCKGDTTKCTSERAKKIDCKHCCNCYIAPLVERIHKENEKN